MTRRARGQTASLAAVVVLLAGCTAMRELRDAVRTDPEPVKTALFAAAREWVQVREFYITEHGCWDVSDCPTFRQIDAAVQAAHDTARKVYLAVRESQPAAEQVLQLIGVVTDALEQLELADPGRRDFYARVRVTLQRLLPSLEGIRSRGEA